MNLIVLTLFGIILQSSSFAVETVKVGVALRFTPDVNSFAPALYQGVEYAQEVFQAQNPGVKIELVKYAHKAGNASVEQAAKKIVKDKVKYVIGGEMSDEAFVLADTFQNEKILLMTPTASQPLLTAGHPNVFRVCFSDDQVANRIAHYVHSLKNIHSIGILHHTSNAYSDYITNAFLDKFSELNKDAVKITEFRYAGDHSDFTRTVENFKKQGVDLVVAFTLQDSIRLFDQLATKAGFNPTYVGGDGWGTNDTLQKSVGTNFKGIRPTYWIDDSKLANVKTFREGFQKKYGFAPDAWNAIAYDTAMILFHSIAKSKGMDAEATSETLRSMVFKEGVTSPSIKFNNRNTAVKPLFLYEITQKGSTFLKEIE